MDDETRNTLLVASTGVGNVIYDVTERYFRVSDDEPDAETKRNSYIKQIAELCDKSKGITDMVAKLEAAEIDATTKIKVAKIDADTKISLAGIDSELRFNISKVESENKLICTQAECENKKEIAEAELKQRRNEMYISLANAGINAGLAVGTISAAKNIITTAFVHEIGDNQIIGRATGTRIANSVSTGVLSHVLRNCIRF